MKFVPYALDDGSLMYTQVCTRPDLAFVTGMLGSLGFLIVVSIEYCWLIVAVQL
jgi:hypothetical protein